MSTTPDVRLEEFLGRLGTTLNVRLEEFIARRYSGVGPAGGAGPPPAPRPHPTTVMSSDTELVACYWSLGEADDREARNGVSAARDGPAGVPARGAFFDRCAVYGRLYDRFAHGKTPLDRGAFIRRCLDDREFFMVVVEALFREEDGAAAAQPSPAPGRPAFTPGPSRPAPGARPGRAIELD